jgi:hypothetical protein
MAYRYPRFGSFAVFAAIRGIMLACRLSEEKGPDESRAFEVLPERTKVRTRYIVMVRHDNHATLRFVDFTLPTVFSKVAVLKTVNLEGAGHVLEPPPAKAKRMRTTIGPF